MTTIGELTTGDELLCFMRLGLALRLAFRPRDRLYYYRVPNWPSKAGDQDLTKFAGTVVSNNTDAGVLTLHVTPVDSHMIAQNNVIRRVDIHYSAFKRVRKYSPIAYEGRTDAYPSRPTSTQGYGTQPRAYRTLEEIEL